MKKHIANIITSCRILCSIIMMFFPVFSVMFYIMNKITGLLLFLFPLTLNFIELKYSAIVLGFVATFSAIQEGHFIRMGKEIV